MFSTQGNSKYAVQLIFVLTYFQTLGYRVVASSSTAVKQDYNEYMWTMRREFPEVEHFAADTDSVVDRDNLSNTALANNLLQKVDAPDE